MTREMKKKQNHSKKRNISDDYECEEDVTTKLMQSIDSVAMVTILYTIIIIIIITM